MRALGTGLTETVSDDVDALRDALGARLAVVAPALGVDVTGLPPAEALDRLARGLLSPPARTAA